MTENPEQSNIVTTGNSPAALMQMALTKGMDLDKLEKLLEIQQKWEANEAKKEYFVAVAAFKENPPQVLKDKENSQFSKSGKKAMYVSLGNLVKTVNPALGAHGLSASWEIGQAGKTIKVTCKLSHRNGHSESVTMTAPPDTSGGNAKNPIQQIKSTITYLKSVTFESVTGIAATEEGNLDDDGNSAGDKNTFISKEREKTLTALIKAKEVDSGKFLKFMGVETLAKIPDGNFNKALQALKKKPAPKRQPGENDA